MSRATALPRRIMTRPKTAAAAAVGARTATTAVVLPDELLEVGFELVVDPEVPVTVPLF